MEGIILKLALGLIGIAIYAVWRVREHLDNFDWGKFFSGNAAFWAWSLSMLILLLLVTSLAPATTEAIKTLVGVDIADEPASFFSVGWALSVLANGAIKKKIGRNHEQ